MFIKYRKIIYDIILNICATALPLIVLQLFIFPLVARKTGDVQYGKMLALISILTIVSGSLGNALNNIRLIKTNEYKLYHEEGDFAYIALIEMIIASLIVCVFARNYHMNIVEFVLLMVLAAMWTYREYAIVAFRIELNFKGIVLNNLVMVVGYVIGFGLFLLIDCWEWIYLFGIASSIAYIFRTSNIRHDPLKITLLVKGTVKELIFLILASIVLNMLNYADRIIIYPMIGAAAVSIYYTSTLFGKIISSAMSPLNAVILSYLAKEDSIQKKNIFIVIGSSIVVALFGYIICGVVAYPVLNILYPDWADESMLYVPVMTLVAMITMVSSVLNPFVMKLCGMKWQLIINLIVLAIYLIFSIYLHNIYGLIGFCYGVLISSIAKCVIMIILSMKTGEVCHK